MEIAHGRFAGENGMVVDIQKRDFSAAIVFNCQFWSDFTEENERFYLGCLGQFHFKTIHNISTNENYEAFIRSISILNTMISASPFNFGSVTSSDILCLSSLINGIIKGRDNNIPDYIRRFYDNFRNQITDVVINMYWMNTDDEGAKKWGCYGYVKYKEIFWKTDCVDLVKLVKIFNNAVKTIIIANLFNTEMGYESSITLDKTFESQLIEFMQFINSSKTIRDRFNHLCVVKPKHSMTSNSKRFVKQRKDSYLRKYRWTLEKRKYVSRDQAKECKDAIFFYPIV